MHLFGVRGIGGFHERDLGGATDPSLHIELGAAVQMNFINEEVSI